MGEREKNRKKVLVVKIEQDDTPQEVTLKEWLKTKVDKVFRDNIPIASIKDMGGSYMYIGGILAYSFFLGCFLYFTWTGYEQARNTKVISLQDDSDNGICENVFRSVTGTWLASSSGLFSGDIEFQYPEAKYSLEFQNFEGTIDKYQTVMESYKVELDTLGQLALTQDLADNILTWITWQILEREDGEVRRFQMIADATSVFNNRYIFGQISTLEHECYVPTSISSFDIANGLLLNQYSYVDFMNNPNCSTIDPHLFGYDERFHGDVFTVGLDVASAVTALAVNKNILRTWNLDLIPTGLEGEPNYVEGPFVSRIDSRIPGMDPIFCIEKGYEEEDIVCVLQLGNMYVVPVYNHFGNLVKNEDCNCDNMNPYCHTFDFMIGVLYYPYNITQGPRGALESFSRLQKLIDTRPFTETNDLAYNASYASVTENLWSTPLFFEKEWREQAYNFCLIDGQYCNIAMFNSYDYENSFLSTFYYNLPRGSCRDSFTADNWELLQNNPPVGLVEEYFQCVPTPSQALFENVGVAAGNSAAFVPLVMVVVLPLIGIYLQATGQAPKRPEYDDEQLEAANRALALFILRVRDKKLRGIKPGGIIRKLSEEMVQTAKSEMGYCDSDDDSDDEEDDNTKRTITKEPSKRRSSAVFVGYRRNSNLRSVRESVMPHSHAKKDLEMTQLDRRTDVYLRGLDICVLNGLGSQVRVGETLSSPPVELALKQLCSVVKEHRLAMEALVVGIEKDGSKSDFQNLAGKIGAFNNISMRDLDDAFASESRICILGLFKDFQLLLDAHFEAMCHFSPNKTTDEKLIPAYTICENIFTTHDMKKIASGASSSPQNIGSPVSQCKV